MKHYRCNQTCQKRRRKWRNNK